MCNMRSDMQLLRKIFEATQRKLLTWSVRDSGSFITNEEHFKCLIEFKYVEYTDETTERAAAIVSVGGLYLEFYDGTEGMDIIVEILGAAFKDWAEHADIVNARRSNVNLLLDKILEN